MDYFFRFQDNPFETVDVGSEDPATESPVDVLNGYSSSNSHDAATGDDEYNKNDDDDENQDDDVRSEQYGSLKPQSLARGFDEADNGDDASSGDDIKYPDDGYVAATPRYFEPRLPSLDNMLPLEQGPEPEKYEVSYSEDPAPDVPDYGMYAIGAVVVFFFLRRCCCARNNSNKKFKSSAKIAYNSSPRYRPVISVV